MIESAITEGVRVESRIKVEWIAVENAVGILWIVGIEWFYVICGVGIWHG